MTDANASFKIADPENIQMTLTITLPVHAWRIVRDGGNWNPFRDAVSGLLRQHTIFANEEGEVRP